MKRRTTSNQVLVPVRRELLSLEELQLLVAEHPDWIAHSHFVPPRLDSLDTSDFGSFDVEYKTSVMRPTKLL